MSKIRTTLGIALFALAASALPAAADLYLGFGSGRSTMADRVAGSTDELDAHDTSEQFFFGFDLGRNSALEFGRIDFGMLADTITIGGVPTPTEFTADGRLITMLFRDEITDDLSLFLRAGVIDWSSTTDQNGGAVVTHANSQNGAFGFGATYSVTDHITFRAEYTVYEVGEVNLEVPSLAVVWGF